MFSLEGQVAIITGGAQGIGEGICKVFCNAGATVALWDVRDAGSTTADNIKNEGGSIFFQKVDITDRAAVDAAVAEIIEGYGKIDILINNAGVLRDRSFLKMTQEEWDTVINVNLSALFTTTQAVFYIEYTGDIVKFSIGVLEVIHYATTFVKAQKHGIAFWNNTVAHRFR